MPTPCIVPPCNGAKLIKPDQLQVAAVEKKEIWKRVRLIATAIAAILAALAALFALLDSDTFIEFINRPFP